MIDLLIRGWELFNAPIIDGNISQAFIFSVPLAIAAASAAAGAYGAKKKADAAREADMFNGEMAAIDTAYSPFVKPQGHKATKTDPGAGMFGGALKGGIAGYQTGAGIKQGMNKQNMYKDMMAGQVAQGGLGGGQYLQQQNAYQGLANNQFKV